MFTMPSLSPEEDQRGAFGKAPQITGSKIEKRGKKWIGVLAECMKIQEKAQLHKHCHPLR
jgi:hypothetical protein